MTSGTAKNLLWVPWVIAGLALALSFSGLSGEGGQSDLFGSMYVAIVGYIIARLFQAELHTSLLRPNNERLSKAKEEHKSPPPIPS
jgi:hypothetical protein